MADVYTFDVLTGTIIPDAQDIQTQVQIEYQNAFGQDLILTPNTPQGMLITAETVARIAVADNNATIANQINPNLAGGVFLDAILALTGSARSPATNTIVSCNLTGVAGTIIPQGSQAQDSVDGSLFESVAEVTLSPGSPGTATVNFQAINTGAISVAANTLTQIISNVLGWETITNPTTESSIGSDTQTDEAARLFRRNTLALQGDALPKAIISTLYATPGVKSLTFRENIAATTQTVDGVSMVAHSIYACVDGGSDEDVAQVLLDKKSGGCAYNNGASAFPVDVTLTVPFSGQVMHILFDRPDIIQILVRATIRADSAIQDPTTVVKKAILDYVNGLLDGEPGLIVGAAVSCFELAGAVNREAPTIYVQNMETSLTSPIVYSNAEITMDIWQKAVIVETSITVVIL